MAEGAMVVVLEATTAVGVVEKMADAMGAATSAWGRGAEAAAAAMAAAAREGEAMAEVLGEETLVGERGVETEAGKAEAAAVTMAEAMVAT
jgi:hypothetical protein